MNFLIKPDYLKHIQNDDLNVITDTNDALLDECELIAIEEIKSYISHRYDVALIFFSILLYDNAKTYAIDDVIYYDDAGTEKIYKCIQAGTGNLPTDVSFWTQTDERSAKIVSMTVDLSLYHLHSRINPRNIPDIRGIRRDDSVKWLEQTRDMKNNPSFLPIVTSDDGTDGLKIKWSSNDKQTNSY